MTLLYAHQNDLHGGMLHLSIMHGGKHVTKSNWLLQLCCYEGKLSSEVLNQCIHVVLHPDKSLDASKVPYNSKEQNRWIVGFFCTVKSQNEQESLVLCPCQNKISVWCV